MLENMFVGRPPGNYDRLLDFSRAVTGSLFFVPSATFLENLPPDAPPRGARRRRPRRAALPAGARRVAGHRLPQRRTRP